MTFAFFERRLFVATTILMVAGDLHGFFGPNSGRTRGGGVWVQ